MTTAGAARRVAKPSGRVLKDGSTIFAAAVIVGVALIGPVAGEGIARSNAAAGARALPSDEVNVALRRAATELAATPGSGDDTQQRALAAIATDSGVALRLASPGTTPCVEGIHPGAPGQVWSYDAATGVIGTRPC